jgi:hypothetical protein
VFVLCFNTYFHIPKYSGSLSSWNVKLNLDFLYRHAVILYFITTALQVLHFSQICCSTKSRSPTLNGRNFALTSEVRTAAILILDYGRELALMKSGWPCDVRTAFRDYLRRSLILFWNDLNSRGYDEAVDWIRLAQNRGPVSGSCERGNETSSSMKSEEFLSSWTCVSFWRRNSGPLSYLLSEKVTACDDFYFVVFGSDLDSTVIIVDNILGIWRPIFLFYFCK